MILSFKTLGCKANQFETGALQMLLVERGHRIAQHGETADVVVVNTCTVTGEASRKSRQAIRRARAEHLGCMVAVCGCLSQLSPEEVEALGADLIGGTGGRAAFAEDLERIVAGESPQSAIDSACDRSEFETLPAGGLEGRIRALVKVQDGCDNFCTYCIIPYARGPVRSMPLDAAVAQTQDLAEAGYKELVITGIEISSYGREWEPGPDVIDLIESICTAVPDLRVRLGSLEPRTVTADFCDRLSIYKNLCPHFHLSLQSGSNETLRRMGRHYDTGRYLESVERLRAVFPNCAITTDLIAGFPGESAAEFDRSLGFLRECAFAAVHVFPYSARTGTQAAAYPEQVPKAERARRAKLAGELAGELRRAWLMAQVGQTMAVLFETEINGRSQGNTPNYCTVSVPGTGLGNQVHSVQMQNISGDVLIGDLQVGESAL